MPDSIVLNGPQGTSIQVGTWLQADPVPDFGDKDLLKATLVENPMVDGAGWGYESVGARHMSLPLVMASGAAGLSLTQIESLLRDAVRPGATIDIQPQGVASADAVRFDVLHGRLEPAYDIRENRVAVRHANLKLDVQPYGYWPTMIRLGSAASIGLPGRMTIPAASIIGDTPAQMAQVTVAPGAPGFLATQYPIGTAYAVDVLGWGLSGHGATSFLAPSAWKTPVGAAATIGGLPIVASEADAFVPQGNVRLQAAGTSLANWSKIAYFPIGTAIEQLYRGRFHAFGYFKLNFSPTNTSAFPGDGWRTASTATAFTVLLDAAPLTGEETIGLSYPMASSGVIATISNNWMASPGYQIVDLGPMSLPPAASGAAQSIALRIWAQGPNGNGHGSHGLAFGGLALIPIDSPAGVLRGGMVQPTIGAYVPSVPGQFFISGRDERHLILSGANAPTTLPNPTAGVALGAGDYRGGLPFVGASTVALELFGGARPWGRQWGVSVDVAHDIPDGYWRFNDAANATQLVDSSGHGNTLQASYPAGAALLRTWAGALGDSYYDLDYGIGPIASALVKLPSYVGFPTTGWTVECWYKSAAVGTAVQNPTAVIWSAASVGAGGSQNIMLGVNGSGFPFFNTNGVALIAATPITDLSLFPSPFGNIPVYPWRHLAFVYSGTAAGASPLKLIYVNGSVAASVAAASAAQYLPTGAVHKIGTATTAGLFLGTVGGFLGSAVIGGALDELAIYPAALPASTMAFRVAANNGSGVASLGIPLHVGPAFGPVSVHYQPAFFFQRGF